jgi:hypothetical protein
MCGTLGRLVVDICRTPKMTPEWMNTHVELLNPEGFREIAGRNERGILLASAHLGSFELLGLALVHYGLPMSVVVRRFSVPDVDAWWNARRQIRGSEVIASSASDRGYSYGSECHEEPCGLCSLFWSSRSDERGCCPNGVATRVSHYRRDHEEPSPGPVSIGMGGM